MDILDANPGTRRVLTTFLSQRFLFMLSYQMRSVAIGWQVYDLTSSPMALGLVGLMQFLPSFLCALPAGYMTDRLNRKKILLCAQWVDSACSLGLFCLVFFGSRALWPIYCLMGIVGAMRPVLGTAGHALLPNLVPPHFFAKAVASASTVWQIAAVAGPAVGGMVYGLTETPATVYAGCFIATLLATLCVAMLPKVPDPTPPKEKSASDNLFSGIRFIWSRPQVLGAISLDLFAVLLGGAVALLPIYARDILHVGPQGLGILRSAPGVGAACMGLLLAFFPLKKRVGPILFTCVFLFGLFTMGFAVSTNVTLSLVLLFLMGAVDLVSVVIRGVLVQVFTPNEMRGRVSAVDLIFIGASNELGEFESGITAAWWGVVPAVIVGGLGTCAVVVLWRYFFPELYRMETLEAPA